jgi:hypothetical protein
MAAVGARYATLRETVHEYHIRFADVLDGPTDDEAEEEEGREGEGEGAEAAGDKENETLSSPSLGEAAAACAALRAEPHQPGDTPAFAFALR